jgi:RecG-like helicase
MAPGVAPAQPSAAKRSLDTPLGSSGLPGATVLKRAGSRLGLLTVRDLLFHLPRRYEDLRDLSTAAQLRRLDDGAVATARLEVCVLYTYTSPRDA